MTTSVLMISDRQKAILKAIIDEFMREAEAVGSMNLVTRHRISASPATVRHEMVELADKGYLTKEHSSSGRIPTDLGLRYFVQELMDEEPLPNTDEVNVRIRVFRNRFDEEKLMSQILSFLSDETGYASVSIVGDTLRFRGISALMDYDELRDVEILEVLMRMFENKSMLERILRRAHADDVCVVIGSECGISGLEPCSVVFSGFGYVGGKSGYLGVVGPRRMRYSRVIPVVKSVSRMVEHAVQGWTQ